MRQQPTILIAEDNAINVMLLKTMLKGVAPEAIILEAKEGETAIALFREQAPDIIFMDIHMPLLDGLGATRAIRKIQHGAAPRIIGLSAASSEEERATALAAGMDDYLVKPLDKTTLANALEKWSS